MKNLLVIGGSYFLGRVFVENLSQNNDYRLYVVNRGNRPLNINGVVEIKCDRNDVARLKEMLPNVSWHAVIDFCAYTPQDISSLLSVLPPKNIKHYIFISTVSVYAPTKALPIKEGSPTLTGPQPELGPAADYGYQKLLAEKTMAMHCKHNLIPFTCLRPGIIYGKYNYAPRESYFFDLIRKGQLAVIPDNDLPLFQFVSVWDAARMIELCMENPDTYNKAFNLSAPELVSYGRLIETLEVITGRPVPKRFMTVAEIDKKRIPLPFPLDSHLIYSGELIQQMLGFTYMSLIDGMQRTYNWYCKELKTSK
ncbi:MAG: NAD-dependent epimerase/dehydratase family protein [Dissulfuribacterales bacterium]